MQVRINDTSVEVPAAAGLMVDDLIEALSVHLEPGSVVTEIQFDGDQYLAGDGSLAWRQVQTTSSLRLTTVQGDVLASDLRQTVLAALDVVTAKVGRTAEFFERGRCIEAQGLLAELLEELKLTMVLDGQSARLAGMDPLTSPDGLETLAAELLAAQEDGNRLRMTHLLSEVLAPMLVRWRSHEDRHDSDTEPN